MDTIPGGARAGLGRGQHTSLGSRLRPMPVTHQHGVKTTSIKERPNDDQIATDGESSG